MNPQQVPPPQVSSTPGGEATYTAPRPDAGAGGVHVEIDQTPDGGFATKCARGPQVDQQTFKSFPELVTYLQSELGSSDASPASDVAAERAGAIAQA